MSETHVTTPTKYIEIDGVKYAYRRWGKPGTVPAIFIQHFRGGMDHWDPLMTDGLAKDREVILFNGRGVASSGGTPRDTFQDMADDIASFLNALEIKQVDAFGFSIGGMQVQELALRHPHLVRKLGLLGSGPRGLALGTDPKMGEVAANPKPVVEDFLFLFFGRSDKAVKAGRDFWERRHWRTVNADPAASPLVIEKQWTAVVNYSQMVDRNKKNPYEYLNAIKQPTLILNGNDDIMIGTTSSFDMVLNIPNSQLLIYEDAGHGAHFQYPERFLKHLNQFLAE
jgi:pimeloyl-ACP methyl ester carboxylesterase